MEMIEGCDCKVKRTRLVRIVDWLCGAMLVGMILFAICNYPTMPDRIPIHYNAGGVIDGYGDKSMIWVLIIISLIPVGIMWAVEQFPRLWNFPFKVTKANQCRLLTLTWHMLSTTKLIVTCCSAYLNVIVVQGGNLFSYFILALPIALVANSLYWVSRLFLNRK